MAFPNSGREISHGSNREQGEAKRLWLPWVSFRFFSGFPTKTPQKGAVKKASLTRRRVRSISQEILESSPPTLMLTSIYAHTILSRARHFKSTQATDARPQSRPSAARRLRGLACDLFQCIAWKYFQGGQDCEKTAGRSRKNARRSHDCGQTARRIWEDCGVTARNRGRLREDYGKTSRRLREYRRKIARTTTDCGRGKRERKTEQTTRRPRGDRGKRTERTREDRGKTAARLQETKRLRGDRAKTAADWIAGRSRQATGKPQEECEKTAGKPRGLRQTSATRRRQGQDERKNARRCLRGLR